jgi:putative ABC transport system ATP-binding protein
LDSESGQLIMTLLLELARDGAAVVIVTHDPSVARQCQRVLRLVDGRLTHA